MNPSQKYSRIKQKKYLCGPTCLQMVLLRKGKDLDQEYLALRLKTRVATKDRHLYTQPLELCEDGDLSCTGLNITQLEESYAKAALAEHSLTMDVHLVSSITDPKEFLAENLEKDHDIMANFYWEPINGRQNGHYVLVCGFDKKTKTVKICDPSDRHSDLWEIKLDMLIDSMDKSWTGEERGFVVIKPKK
jgi:hypothetical protein